MICPDPKCCQDLDIDPLHLLSPHLLDEAGREFLSAHGLDGVPLGEVWARSKMQPSGKLRVVHRCQHLMADGACAIYETRPTICRDFDCRTRTDCVCQKGGTDATPG